MSGFWEVDFYVFSGGVYLGIAWFFIDLLLSALPKSQRSKTDPVLLAIQLKTDDAEKCSNSGMYKEAYLSIKSAFFLFKKRSEDNYLQNNPFMWRHMTRGLVLHFTLRVVSTFVIVVLGFLIIGGCGAIGYFLAPFTRVVLRVM